MNDQHHPPLGVAVDRDVGRLRQAVAYSHNFATAKPDIGDAEREHLLGLCALLLKAADTIVAIRSNFDNEWRRAALAERAAERLRAENKALRESIDISRLPRLLADLARNVALVLDAATALVGDRQKALQWYRTHLIADFGGRTPMRMVKEGKTQAVLDYIESLGAGASG